MIIASILLIIFSLGITSNLLLMLVLLCEKRAWTSTIMYLFHLTVSDFLFLSTVPFWAYMYLDDHRWYFGWFMCKLCGFVPTFNMFSSIFFLTAIAIDRWLAVVHSTSHRFRSWSAVKRVCAFIWILAAALGAHRGYFMNLRVFNMSLGNTSNITSYDNATTTATMMMTTVVTAVNETKSTDGIVQCAYSMNAGKMVNGAIDFSKSTIGFFIPITIIVFSYTTIIYTVKKNTMETSQRAPVSRVTKLTTAAIICFVICWFPYQLFVMYSGLCGWWNVCSMNEILFNSSYPYVVCLAWTNSIMNPILYAFTTPMLRQTLRGMLTRPFRRCNQICRANRRRNAEAVTMTTHTPLMTSSRPVSGSFAPKHDAQLTTCVSLTIFLLKSSLKYFLTSMLWLKQVTCDTCCTE